MKKEESSFDSTVLGNRKNDNGAGFVLTSMGSSHSAYSNYCLSELVDLKCRSQRVAIRSQGIRSLIPEYGTVR